MFALTSGRQLQQASHEVVSGDRVYASDWGGLS